MAITSEAKILGGVLIITLVIVVSGAFLIGGSNKSEPATVASEILVRATSPSLGPADANVTVVEFGDFECPACGALHPLLQQVKDANKDTSVRFVYRHFPLSQHSNAQAAAEAAAEAGRQGKFWEFHDRLFEHQDQLDRANLEKHAQEVGLDLNAFKEALDRNTHRAFVLDDRRDGEIARVTGTPTVFINGVHFTGQYSIANLQAAIDAATD